MAPSTAKTLLTRWKGIVTRRGWTCSISGPETSALLGAVSRLRSQVQDDSVEAAAELAIKRKPGFTAVDTRKFVAIADCARDRALANMLCVALVTMMRQSEIVTFKPASISPTSKTTRFGDQCATATVTRRKTERTSQAQQRVLLRGQYTINAEAALAAMNELQVSCLGEMYGASGQAAVRALTKLIRELGGRTDVGPDKVYAYSCRHGGAERFAELGPLLLRLQGGRSSTSTIPQQFYQGGSTERALEALAAQERVMAPHHSG